MKRKILLSVIPILATFAWAPNAKAICVDQTSCYCRLQIGQDRDLVYAEVVSLGSGTANLEIIGSPLIDRSGMFADGMLAEELAGGDSNYLAVGDFGIFSLNAEEWTLVWVITFENGLMPCASDGIFPGLTVDQLREAINSLDCPAAVYGFGMEHRECKDTFDECGCSSGSPEGFSFFALASLFGLLRARSRP